MGNLRLRSSWTACVTSGLLIVLAGCRTASHAESGALLGAGLGTAAGAIIGHQSGHTEGGALIGAVAGGLAGGLAGDAEDAREERDAAIAHTRYQQDLADYQTAKVAVTNLDLIDMADARLSDRVILNAVQTRGGQFDLSPSAIIELKRHGLSDEVILEIQRSNGRRTTIRPEYTSNYNYPPTTVLAPPPPPVYIAPRAPTVGIVVTPRPYFGFSYGYGYGRYHGPHHRHHGHRW